MTYGEAWRKLRLYVPAAPALLIQDWFESVYKRVCEEKNWSFLRSEGEFLVQASRSGTVNLTQGSATVPGDGGAAGMTWVAADVGRQVRYSSVGPPLTVVSVDLTGTTSATLERVWDGVTVAGASITISDIYATCPADFGHFIAVLDGQNQRQIRIFTTDAELNAADAWRTNTGQPWALVNYRLSTLSGTLGRVQYEWWPYWTGSGTLRFPFYYYKRPTLPAEDDTFLGPLRERADVVLLGAKAEAAEWPGTREAPNPYFNLALARELRSQFMYQVGLLEVRDEEEYLTWWIAKRLGTYGMSPLAPNDARYLQEHDL